MKPATFLLGLFLWTFALVCAFLLLNTPILSIDRAAHPEQAELLAQWTRVNAEGQLVLHAQFTGPAQVRLHLPAVSPSQQPHLVSEYHQATAQTLYRVEIRLCHNLEVTDRPYYWEMQRQNQRLHLAEGQIPPLTDLSLQTLQRRNSPCANTDVLRPFLHENDPPPAFLSYLSPLGPGRTADSPPEHPGA